MNLLSCYPRTILRGRLNDYVLMGTFHPKVIMTGVCIIENFADTFEIDIIFICDVSYIKNEGRVMDHVVSETSG